VTLSYPKAIEYLYGLQQHGIKLGLENSRRLMTVLDEPHRRFRSVHIAGTNGKGSTAAMIATVLAAAGYRTGLYTSPHLIDFTERIRVNGEPISPDAVARLTERIRAAAADLPPPAGRTGAGEAGLPVTFFEFTTAMAFLHFAESAVDFAVAEVGMGGRYDATNVLTPLVTVITQIDFDHQAYLGDTIERIAAEKAGIIKPAVPVVTAADRPEAMSVIENVSREQKAPLYRLGFEVRVEGATPQRFRYQGIRWSLSDLNCSLLGKHQLSNAGCALAALELLEPCLPAGGRPGITIGEAPVRQGLSTVRWEGRLERMPPGPSGAAVILDGAHNPAGARVLRTFLEESRPPRPGRLILVLGILRDKDIGGILAELIPIADEVVVTRPRHERAASTDDLKRHLEKYAVPAGKRAVRATVREPLEEALRYAQSASAAADLICITGSLYTVGEARAYLNGLPQPSALRG
jgi:dihydrofolate synthase/folylpolyglutamate synthase